MNTSLKKTIIICGKSAEQFWRSPDIDLKKLYQRSVPDKYVFNVRKKDAVEVANALRLDLPLYVMSMSKANVCHGQSLVCQARTQSYPKNGFVGFSYSNYNILVESPELLFLEKSKSLSFCDCVKFGCELCGYYFLKDEMLVNHNPITTKERLKKFLRESKGLIGRKKAIRAIEFVVDNSRSPRETGIAIIALFPIREGGYGMAGLTLNEAIPLYGYAAKILGKPVIVVDITWQNSKVAIEYNSNAYHAEPEELTRDAKRSIAMQLSKYRYIVITAGIMNDFNIFDTVMKGVRHELGLEEMKTEFDNNYEKRKELYEMIVWDKMGFQSV